MMRKHSVFDSQLPESREVGTRGSDLFNGIEAIYLDRIFESTSLVPEQISSIMSLTRIYMWVSTPLRSCRIQNTGT